jgi:hypothetical protein
VSEPNAGTDAASDIAQSPAKAAKIAANDIAVSEDGTTTDGLVRFHAALSNMTGRRGIRNEISRYEAMSIALVEPRGEQAGAVFPDFPPAESPLHLSKFFGTLYQRYEERFVAGAPLLAERGITRRFEWAPESEVFSRSDIGATTWPELDFLPRLA